MPGVWDPAARRESRTTGHGDQNNYSNFRVTASTRSTRPYLFVVNPVRARAMPDHMYVPVPAVAKAVSAFVFITCVLSLAMSFLTGFTLIDRFFSVIFAVAAVGFFVMGQMFNAKIKR
jgi:hypothetical protein